MSFRRSAGLAVVGVVLFGMAGCDGGTPPSGSRAIVPSDHLEKQQARLEQIKEKTKARPTVRPGRRPSIGA
jgi:hypothetical protein